MDHNSQEPVRQGKLVVSRRVGERIFIDGGRIIVTLESILGHKARLSVVAPGMVVDREEVHNAKQEGKRDD